MERLERGIGALLVLLVVALLPQLWSMFQTLHNYAYADVYPVGAVNYLRLHSQPKRVFSLYDWNSFILWKLTGTKVFIDGMMPSWKWSYSGLDESSYAFREYQEVLMGRIGLRDEIAKYGIDGVVLPADSKSLDDVQRGYAISGLERQVKEVGWRRVYGDGTAVVYMR